MTCCTVVPSDMLHSCTDWHVACLYRLTCCTVVPSDMLHACIDWHVAWLYRLTCCTVVSTDMLHSCTDWHVACLYRLTCCTVVPTDMLHGCIDWHVAWLYHLTRSIDVQTDPTRIIILNSFGMPITNFDEMKCSCIKAVDHSDLYLVTMLWIMPLSIIRTDFSLCQSADGWPRHVGPL